MATKGVVGSLWYLSPEQVTGKRDLDKRVDIYALGILLYELLTGEVPFRGESSYDIMRAHVDQPMPSVCAVRPDVPAAVDAILARACAKDRDDRFASCDDFAEALAPLGAGKTLVGTEPPMTTVDVEPLAPTGAAASRATETGTSPGTAHTRSGEHPGPRRAPRARSAPCPYRL